MIEKDKLYPFIFEPIYMERMWGGNYMTEHLGRKLPKGKKPIGEAWELSDRDDAQSIVANGPLKGASLKALVEHYGKNLVGSSFRGGKFPLLVKLIDAGKRLSLQVHPDEGACAKLGEGAEPKTEMWYVIACDRDAKIMSGLKGSATKRQFMDSLNSPDIEDYLQVSDSRPGDAYFINSRRIHAIGAGNLLLEIQQNSDTTFRVSDWGRVDQNGKSRELHLEKALKCIDFMDRTSSRIAGVSDAMAHNRKFPIINKCPFFRVDDLRLVEKWQDTTQAAGSFNLITAINYPVKVGRDERMTRVEPGSTCLIPASFGRYSIILEKEDDTTTVLKTTL